MTFPGHGRIVLVGSDRSERSVSGMRAASVIVMLLAIVAASEASAFDIETTRPMALAGGSRAQCPSNAALYLNPAGLSLARVYHVETLYSYVPTSNGHVVGASVVDSVTSTLAMGLSFNYITWDPDHEDRSEYDVRLAAAYAIGSYFALGLTLKYLYAEMEGRGPLGPNVMERNGDDPLNTVTVDVGAIITIRNMLNIGVVGYNLTSTGSSSAPISLGTALSLQLRNFAIVADVLLDFTTREDLSIRVMGGAEYFLANHYPIRLGYRYDDGRGSHAISGGFGYVSQSWGIEISLRQDVSAEDLETVLGLTLRYFAN
jgi:opacity protein-like surface antigen